MWEFAGVKCRRIGDRWIIPQSILVLVLEFMEYIR